MKVTAQYAQEHFTELLETADRGEEIEIAREGKPSYRLFLVPGQASSPQKLRILGAYEGRMKVPSYEEWKAMDLEIEEEMTIKTLDLTGLR